MHPGQCLGQFLQCLLGSVSTSAIACHLGQCVTKSLDLFCASLLRSAVSRVVSPTPPVLACQPAQCLEQCLHLFTFGQVLPSVSTCYYVSQCFKTRLSVHPGQCLSQCLHLGLCKFISVCVEKPPAFILAICRQLYHS